MKLVTVEITEKEAVMIIVAGFASVKLVVVNVAGI